MACGQLPSTADNCCAQGGEKSEENPVVHPGDFFDWRCSPLSNSCASCAISASPSATRCKGKPGLAWRDADFTQKHRAQVTLAAKAVVVGKARQVMLSARQAR